jgi:hypothetical protein
MTMLACDPPTYNSTGHYCVTSNRCDDLGGVYYGDGVHCTTPANAAAGVGCCLLDVYCCSIAAKLVDCGNNTIIGGYCTQKTTGNCSSGNFLTNYCADWNQDVVACCAPFAATTQTTLARTPATTESVEIRTAVDATISTVTSVQMTTATMPATSAATTVALSIIAPELQPPSGAGANVGLIVGVVVGVVAVLILSGIVGFVLSKRRKAAKDARAPVAVSSGYYNPTKQARAVIISSCAMSCFGVVHTSRAEQWQLSVRHQRIVSARTQCRRRT